MKSLLFVILVFSISCKKNPTNESYVITGIVFDRDLKSATPGAKVYLIKQGALYVPSDSAVSDGNGRVIFTVKKSEIAWLSKGSKLGYESPVYAPLFGTGLPPADRSDTLFLVKASYVNVSLQKSGSYLNTDTIFLTISGYRQAYPLGGTPMLNKQIVFGLKRAANAADTVLTISTAYLNPPYQKAYFGWDILRNNAPISNQTDSTVLIQYGTQSHTISY